MLIKKIIIGGPSVTKVTFCIPQIKFLGVLYHNYCLMYLKLSMTKKENMLFIELKEKMESFIGDGLI